MLVLSAAQASDCFAPPPPCTGNSAHLWRFRPSARLRGGAGLRVGDGASTQIPSAVSELTEGAISKQAVATLEQQGFVVIQVSRPNGPLQILRSCTANEVSLLKQND